MTAYDTTTPRSRQNQRIAYPETLSRAFDHRANALTVSQTQGTPYYADANGNATMSVINATNAGKTEDFHPYLHHTVSLYVLNNPAGNAGIRCQVRVTAETQLGHYVEVFNENCVVEQEYRFSTAYRKIRVVATATQAGESYDVYLGGE